MTSLDGLCRGFDAGLKVTMSSGSTSWKLLPFLITLF